MKLTKNLLPTLKTLTAGTEVCLLFRNSDGINRQVNAYFIGLDEVKKHVRVADLYESYLDYKKPEVMKVAIKDTTFIKTIRWESITGIIFAGEAHLLTEASRVQTFEVQWQKEGTAMSERFEAISTVEAKALFRRKHGYRAMPRGSAVLSLGPGVPVTIAPAAAKADTFAQATPGITMNWKPGIGFLGRKIEEAHVRGIDYRVEYMKKTPKCELLVRVKGTVSYVTKGNYPDGPAAKAAARRMVVGGDNE